MLIKFSRIIVSEEVDELDSKLMLTGTILDVMCELLSGVESNNTLQQEAVVRWIKLFFGNVTEPMIQGLILHASDKLTKQSTLSVGQHEPVERSIDSIIDKLARLLTSKLPHGFKIILGESDAKQILKYFFEFFKVQKINQDMNLHLLDVVASQLLASCRANQTSPVC